MTDLLDRVAAYSARHHLLSAGDVVVVGVSGGVDSLTLAHVLRAWGHYTLHLATLDHGLRGTDGADDVAYVQALGRQWGLHVIAGWADVAAAARAHRLSIEEAARQVRYTFLLSAARYVSAARIAVGHNQDDQAETVLMHLIRGSGLGGLRGMLPQTSLSTYHLLPDVDIVTEPHLPPEAETVGDPDGWPPLIRPLLDTPRHAINAYAATHDLHPRQDETNAERTYFRNRLRHDVLPLLATLNPNIRATLARTAEVLRGDADIVAAAGQAALARVVSEFRTDAVLLDADAWQDLTLPEKRFVLRASVFRLRPGLRDVALTHIDAAIDLADQGEPERAATLPGGLLLRVGRGVLSVGAAEAHPLAAVPGQDAPALVSGWESEVFFPETGYEVVHDAWRFACEPRASRPAPDELATLHANPLTAVLWVPHGAWLKLRTWRPADRFAPRGLGGTQKLAATFSGMQVPASWRRQAPVLVIDDVPAWFVAPAPQQVRSRVSAHYAAPDADATAGRVYIVVGWQRIDAV